MTELIHDSFFTCHGDITRIRCDAVVNAANSSLLGGGGVDGAIHAAGGKTILAACKQLRKLRYPDGLPPGEAAATTAGKLKASYVIHTVGPVWQGGTNHEDALLASCFLSSLTEAENLACSTVAFPAVSTGAYGFPKERFARIAFKEIKDFLGTNPRHVKKIYLVFFSHKDERIFLEETQRGMR